MNVNLEDSTIDLKKMPMPFIRIYEKNTHSNTASLGSIP